MGLTAWALGAAAAACSGGGGQSGPADGAGDDVGVGAEAGGPLEDAADACTKTGDLASFDAGCQWACITAACSAQAQACDMNCPCNNAVLQALLCSADGGSAFSCFAVALVNAQASALLTCSQNANAACASSCGGGGDGSSE
ncbi:MAG TPA: hypothetical protein VE987_03650 [Polyangiaceae bacterium]|nr:hypothetical protein [Polyangiaceae bacterium]